MGFEFPQLLPWLWVKRGGPLMVAALVGITFLAIATTVADVPWASWADYVVWGITLFGWYVAILWHTHEVARSLRIKLIAFGRMELPNSGQVWTATLHITNRPGGAAVGLATVYLLVPREKDFGYFLVKATPTERDAFLGTTPIGRGLTTWILDAMTIEANASLSGSIVFIDHFAKEAVRGAELVIEELSGRCHRFKPLAFGKAARER